ncbi:putative inorganic phosphate cotransporter isoform X2 [Argiope bruennichi]|nr:putative inorganic phosphate cotransporter isoform X2 [Argiope bruennichi]
MVNNSAVNSHKSSNVTVDSCPVNSSITEENNAALEAIGEFDWSPSVQGNILGAGFLGYVVTQMLGGLWAEKYGAKITIIGGLFLSSLAHILSPLAAWTSGNLMIAMQLIRGIGQGLIPAAHCVVAANWFPKNERAILNALSMSGYCLGALVGSISSGFMCLSPLLGGWPSVYYVYGGSGLLLCLSFQIFLYETPKCHPYIKDSELNYILQNQENELSHKRPPTPWKKILTSVPLYAVTYAISAAFWVGSHFLSVHSIFLGTILHFSLEENGFFTSFPLAIQMVFSYTGGWISKWLETRNYVGTDKLRKGFNLLFCIGYSLGLIGVIYVGCDRMWSNIIAIIAMGFAGFVYCGCMTTVIDMSPTFAGTVMGLSSTIASLASFIFPVLVGFMTNEKQTIEQWNNIFWICIGITMSSGIIFCVFGSAEVQPWNDPSTETKHKTESKDTLELDSEYQMDIVTHM